MISLEIFMQMLFLLAPAGIANTAPVWGAKLPWLRRWNTPLDCGLKYGGQRLLGDNKTWRGLALGAFFGGLSGAVLATLSSLIPYVGRVDVFSSEINLVLLGVLLGCGALAGDALKSFCKRRIGLRPGQSWPVMDQIDYILGAYIITGFIFDLTPTHYLVGLLTYALVHPFISYAAYLLRLKRDKF
ncbi:CDP-archaeol synthase [Candidatus Saccharibacteria bacterium]|nr:CDP-archaeol synthase [Candidatus Saccharibacteria bacterium]